MSVRLQPDRQCQSVSVAVPSPSTHADASNRAQSICLLVLDVDGTMTDGRINIGSEAELFKSFSVQDGFGLRLLREAGVRLAIVTGRSSAIVARRAAELQIDLVLQGSSDKGAALGQLLRQLELRAAQAAFMGDDWPDAGAMRQAGLAIAAADAVPEIRALAHWVGSRTAGDGAIREFADWWLRTTGRWQDALRRHGLAG